jgi:hypothetical protein
MAADQPLAADQLLYHNLLLSEADRSTLGCRLCRSCNDVRELAVKPEVLV